MNPEDFAMHVQAARSRLEKTGQKALRAKSASGERIPIGDGAASITLSAPAAG
jgi:hypothetical protein